MFGKILIANRGEIACRIIRTARKIGIRTVAVYSDADRNAQHVRDADEAVRIGPAPAAQSYLSIDAIVAACRQTGAEAVHPGYGFLSEQVAFAEALARTGIAFIGPNTGAIAAMGDKIVSKKAAAAAGVSTVPGHPEAIDTADEAVGVATAIGFPVMIKASAGGGGKGMRIAFDALEARDGFLRARSEAASSFGDDRVFIEKFIQNPRHIEIQVLGDKHGNVIHLGERECSVQRRNQKVLEEAPSPLLDDETRQRMGAEAVALAKAVNYDSAGTVEFVVGQDKSFYFLEMNTRLQVEHPVTEFVTGLDLVEQMIRVAAGAPLALRQQDVRLNGWAVEARVYAEDPAQGFLPSTGRLSMFRPPETTPLLRIDAGVREGDGISVYYDPMIAKVITHAPTRAEAISAQAEALDAFVIEGVETNLPFLSALMHLPRWRKGELSTSLIEDEYGSAAPTSVPEGDLLRRLASICAFADTAETLVRHARPGRAPMPKRRNLAVVVGDTSLDGAIEIRTPTLMSFCFSDDGATLTVESDWQPPQPVFVGRVDGERIVCRLRRRAAGFVLDHAGRRLEAMICPAGIADLSAALKPKSRDQDREKVFAPMPGLLRELFVTVGDEVTEGQQLAVMEAMKMEISVRAGFNGCVRAVLAEAGSIVANSAPLLLVERVGA